jgi:hypothetical protein
MHRSFSLSALAALLAAAALALGGCAVQAAGDDPASTATEEAHGGASEGTADPAQATATPVANATGTYTAPARQPLTTAPKGEAQSADPTVKPQSTPCTASSPCPGTTSDNTEPLPWAVH